MKGTPKFQRTYLFSKLKNFFAKLIFFPPKLFLVFWKREILLSKKKIGGKKINLAKTILPIPDFSTLEFTHRWRLDDRTCETIDTHNTGNFEPIQAHHNEQYAFFLISIT
jgi:hypothetical protein